MSSTQITARLPSELVEAIDREVAGGATRSRAAAVTEALKQNQRRKDYERDAYIYATKGENPDLVALSQHASRTLLDTD